MKTSASPVSVSRVGQTPVLPMPGEPVVLSIGLSQPKAAEERVYLRWSTDSFITSQLLAAQGSGTTYSATLPGQPSGTLVLYTLVTSTADLTAYSVSGVIDSLILATTGVFNAMRASPIPTPTPTPTPSPSPSPTATPTPTPDGPPQITQQPADISVRVGRRAKFRVLATGALPLTYQWRKNGAVIAGATASRYSTPPTAQTDNGSLFSVVVSNNAGSTTSNNAVLTVK